MKNHTLIVKVAKGFSIDQSIFTNLGLKEIPRSPRRIRSDEEDDMRQWSCKIPYRDFSLMNSIQSKLTEIGYCFETLPYGKRLLGFIEQIDVEYRINFYK